MPVAARRIWFLNPFDILGGDMFKSVLQRFGYKHKARPFSNFIDFKMTMKAATVAGLSVGEYLERRHSAGPTTSLIETIDKMASLGVFRGNIDHVCEIGPGSGRYLKETSAHCKPSVYEIYETSAEWRNWLVREYGVVAWVPDGRTLSNTASESVDLVHAHKLFPGLPLLATLSYFREMARVARVGGWIVFDMTTENCFTADTLQSWFDANPWDWDWSPHMCSLDYILKMFAEQGVVLVDKFQVALFPGVTECLVLRKEQQGRVTPRALQSGRE